MDPSANACCIASCGTCGGTDCQYRSGGQGREFYIHAAAFVVELLLVAFELTPSIAGCTIQVQVAAVWGPFRIQCSTVAPHLVSLILSNMNQAILPVKMCEYLTDHENKTKTTL